jgi:dihydroorotate dehydrogenase (fumarate)
MTIDLSTTYLGIKLRTPLVASASPCTGQPDVLRRLEASGAGAAVLPSLFEEQLLREDPLQPNTDALGRFPSVKHYNLGADHYLRLIETARRSVAIPIIASLNGATLGTWVEQAQRIESAGADALELNLHFVPIDPHRSSQQVETQYLEVLAAVRNLVQIPLAVKIGPYFSSLPYFARQAVELGANGLVLFNRYLEPEVNLEDHTINSHLELSQPVETRLALRWLGVLRDQLPGCSLAASSGISSGEAALKALAVGADVAMVTSVLLKQGAEYLQTIQNEMVEWLSHHGYTHVRRLLGSMSREQCGTPEAFERANYAQTLSSYLEQGAHS